MKNTFIAIAVFAAALLTSSCGDSEHFRIKGVIEGNPTMNLRVSYMSDGKYVPIITAARDGEFEISGVSSYGTVVEISNYENKLLGRTYAVNGEEIELILSPDDPNRIEAEGSAIAGRWASFLHDNAEVFAGGAADSMIAEYVGRHPEDIVSTLLLITSYDSSRNPAEADSLLQLIEPAARPASLTEDFNNLLQRMVAQGAAGSVTPFHFLDRRDSIRLFRPSDAEVALLVFDNNRCGRADSIVPTLKKLNKRHGGTKLQILEMSIDGDTTAWKRDTRMDTASWNQAWGAGGYGARGISRLAIPGVPYCVVCDSTGRQVLRTRSISEARDTIKSILEAHH